MHFLICETLSFNLMYVAACYPVGTTISKTSPLFTALLQDYLYSCLTNNILYYQTQVKQFSCCKAKQNLYYLQNQLLPL